jgi:hypothetical protein
MAQLSDCAHNRMLTALPAGFATQYAAGIIGNS